MALTTASADHGSRSTASLTAAAAIAASHQRETPLFQGMKSSCPSNSALVRSWPLATSHRACGIRGRFAAATETHREGNHLYRRELSE
jgi:hypothetical protein